MIHSTIEKLVIVGNAGVVHVGAHLVNAAAALGHLVFLVNSEQASSGGRFARSISWRVRGHRPSRLRAFSDQVAAVCRNERPRWMLATGIAPIEERVLKEIGKLGVVRLNYLTDDPWNPAHAAPWFMKALREYDSIFSTRRANLADLRQHGCRGVSYLPFAYAPSLHYAYSTAPDADERFAADIVFAGGADSDRVPLISALISEGFKLALYGGYWDRYSETRKFSRGHAGVQLLRTAIAAAKVSLCLVRRANRDGSAMRTFEVAAMGACMLVEDTDEHRQILGEDGQAVVFIPVSESMVERLRWLLNHDVERNRLGAAVQARITSGRNTYGDRLETMLAAAASGFSS